MSSFMYETAPPYTRVDTNPVKKNLLKGPKLPKLLQYSHSVNPVMKIGKAPNFKAEYIPVDPEYKTGAGKKKKKRRN